MRKSFNTLGALVEQQMRRSVLGGDLLLFVSRDRKRAKVLYFDGTGMCLLSKRLDSVAARQGPVRAAVQTQVGRRRRAELPSSENAAELGLFIEGSETVGRLPMSPPLLERRDLRTRFGEQTRI